VSSNIQKAAEVAKKYGEQREKRVGGETFIIVNSRARKSN
jgi:hypothetical protein